MTPRALLLGLLGVVAALAIGIGAHLVSNDSVGLADAPLRSVDSLAPERAERPAAGAAERARAARARARARRRQRTRRAQPVPVPAPPTTTPPATPTVDDHGGLTEPGDDRGGSNSGPGGGGSSGHGGGDD